MPTVAKIQIKQHRAEGAKDALWFQIQSLPDHGTLQRYNGTEWVNITQADIDNGLWLPQNLLTEGGPDKASSGLRYLHDGSEPLSYTDGKTQDQFTFVVRDDLSATQNANIQKPMLKLALPQMQQARVSPM